MSILLKWFTCFCLATSLVNPVLAQTVKLVAAEWAPYTSASYVNQGVAAQIVKAAFERSGYIVEFDILPWQRAQHMVTTGEKDGLGISWFTEERSKSMLYSEPYLDTEIILIKRKDDPKNYTDPDSFSMKNFGVLRGYGYLSSIPSKTYKTTVLDTLEQSYNMLAIGRIDLALEERLNAHITLSKLPYEVQDQIEFGRALDVRPLHITISKQRPDGKKIIHAFNQGLHMIMADGTYLDILQQYSPQPLSRAE